MSKKAFQNITLSSAELLMMEGPDCYSIRNSKVCVRLERKKKYI